MRGDARDGPRSDSRDRPSRSESRDYRGSDRRGVDDDRARGARRDERYNDGSRRDGGAGESLPPPPPIGDARASSRSGEPRSADRARDRPRHHDRLSWAEFERRSGHDGDGHDTDRSNSRDPGRGSPGIRRSDQPSNLRPGARTGTPPAASRPAGGNSLLAELRRAGQSLVGRDKQGTGPSPPAPAPARRQPPDGSEGSDLEAGEIIGSDGDEERRTGDVNGHGSERKRRYNGSSAATPESPSGTGTGSRGGSKAPRLGGGGGLLDRAMDDVAAFQAARLGRSDGRDDEGVDPDAPVALKSSPSVSGSGDERENSLDAKLRRAAEQRAGDDSDAAGGGSGGGGVGGMRSRWLVDAAEDDEGGGGGSGVERNGGAVPGSGLGPGSAGESDSEDAEAEGAPASAPAGQVYDMLRECRNVDEFEKINRISEGTYGVVYKAREKKTGRLVALKMIKMEKERDGFPVTSIREINVMLNFHHPNIVHVSEICVGKRADQVFMVMELMDHDLKSIMDPKSKDIRMTRAFSVSDVKNLMLQMLAGVHFLHANWVLHRDLKSSNILYNSKGELKICDFGLARQYGSPLKPYTHMVVTLWYRAPELLLGCKIYSTAVDVWSLGCIMGELLLGTPLIMGQSELEQLDKMVQLLGTPTEEVWPGIVELHNYGKIKLRQVSSQLRSKFQTAYGGGAMLTEKGFDLLSRLLAWDPTQRISAEDAMQHPWFSEGPLPQKKELMPTFAPR